MDVYSVFKPANQPNKRYNKYTSLLSCRHPGLRKLIKIIGSIDKEVPIWTSINDAVLYAVVGQMLSISASGAIIKRLNKEVGSSSRVMAWAQKTTHTKGPVNGVSQRKRMALAEWLSYIKRSGRAYLKWKNLALEEYRKQIEQIWGFGPWSADMIAIFYLGRMDVWPSADAGIQRACKLVFGAKEASKAVQYVNGCETVAAIYMWELLNRKLEREFSAGA